ncbi:serpin family protein [Planctomycetota bacterium]
MNSRLIFKSIFVVICAVLFVSGCAFAISENGAENNSRAISQSINEFAFNLYGRIKELPEIQKAEGNLFFSPYSISSALTMTFLGARGNTATEMANVLEFSIVGDSRTDRETLAGSFGKLQQQLQADPETSGYQLNIANALWGQEGYDFLAEFLELNSKYYGSGLNKLNFAQSEEARRIINTWIEEQTNEKIKDLIPSGSINAMTRLVLTNAIYFKGDWAIQFKEENTNPADFNVTGNKTVEVPMMYQKETFGYSENDDMQLLQLPYKGDELSMLVILPKTIDALASVESSLNSETIESSLSQIRKREVDVYLPKFKMTCGTIELNRILSEMGMKDAFSDSADFSGMSGRRDLYISNVMHKAFVEVNEEGTEAAAATAVGMRLLSMPAPVPIFRADRPFIFMIFENNSKSILFIGRVANPTIEG